MGFVLPGFYFALHHDVKNNLGQKSLTFNTIHTDQFRATIQNRKSEIPNNIFEEIEYYLDIYDKKLDYKINQHNNEKNY